MNVFAKGDRVFSKAHLDSEPGIVTGTEVEQGVELVSVTWEDDYTTREEASDLYLDDYSDEELAVDRAWAGNVDYDDLAEQADEKMSPPWIEDGYGAG